MRNTINQIIESEFKGKKLRDYLKFDLKLSSRMIKNLAKNNLVFINRKASRMDYILKGGERLTINLDKEESQNIKPVKMDLTVVFEDDSLIVLDKPPFMVVHPTKSHQEDTLANGLLYYFNEHKDNSIVRFVSRLDMNTSGLIIVAKNQFTHSYFARLKDEDKIIKEYIAITEGEYGVSSGTINLPISKEALENFRREVRDDGQIAITHFNVLELLDGYSVVKFRLETGRTHQIRVHSSSIGHPLVNDVLYGGKSLGTALDRQFLHASFLKFIHPMTGNILELHSDIPIDMKEFILSKRK